MRIYNLKRLSLCLALCATLLPLNACSDLLATPEPLQILTLNHYDSDAPLCKQQSAAQLVINMPEAYAGTNSDRIPLLIDNREIQYLAGYKWDKPAQLMVHQALVQAFNTSGCIKGAASGGAGLVTPYRLSTDIMRMHHIQNGDQKSVKVELVFTLVNIEKGTIIGQLTTQANGNGNFTKPVELAANIEKALNIAINDGVVWVAGVLKESEKAN
ncbi:ABC-type transport auxiliary lipoprotein family protein [Desulfovibrio sp. OttesenSCG-928-F07]|nr:ABC-type transport auxiliary lipoprotein family protein [Desulfovibrio sp. OttesenSCG-928-F07]